MVQAPNNVVRYEITADLEDRECFLLNDVTGDLLLRRSLLYDPCRSNSFSVSLPADGSLSVPVLVSLLMAPSLSLSESPC